MSGHNKWSKVKHIKAKEDAKKGKTFSKFSHEISIAARDGGGDPDLNPRLRAAIDGAKAVSMPKDGIERAIKKGTGELGGEAIQELTYEGYGPGGIALIVEVATDNTNRSANDIRSTFTKNGGNIATPGSVSYQFDRMGEIKLDRAAGGEDEILLAALEAGAADVQSDSDEHLVFTKPTELNAVAVALRAAGYEPRSERLVSVPQNLTVLRDTGIAKQALRLYEVLDDYPDTMNVFANFEIADEILVTLDD